jgi:GTP-binding protein Era
MQDKKCITVAIVGAPNVGKSSLLNRMISSKVSIVSPKPHTTRNNTLGYRNFGNTQIVFTDTPGYIRMGTGIWDEHLIEQLESAVERCDLTLIVVDGTRPKAFGTEIILKAIANNPKTLVVINKVDMKARGKMYPLVENIIERGYEQTVYLVSAKTGKGMQHLIQHISDIATVDGWMFEDNMELVPKHVYAAECVREKLMHLLNQEIPFQIWTRAVEWKFDKHEWKIKVDIVVTKTPHKRMVIGKGGHVLKNVGIAARTELESMWGLGHLFLHVIIEKDWIGDQEKIAAICSGEIMACSE